MKPTVGLLLLLLAAYYCAAAPQEPIEIGECCFRFFTRRIPARKIVFITKTHWACRIEAFVITTTTGRKFCVSQSEAWAEEAYNQQEITDE